MVLVKVLQQEIIRITIVLRVDLVVFSDTVPSTKENYCIFKKGAHSTPLYGEEDFVVNELVPGKYFYGVNPSTKLALKNVYLSTSFTDSNLLDYLRYDPLFETGYTPFNMLSPPPLTTNSEIVSGSTSLFFRFRDAILSIYVGTVLGSSLYESPYQEEYVGSVKRNFYKKFVSQNNLVPFKACFVKSGRGTNYGDNPVDPDYRTGYYYSNLKCNGLNSFCDPQNLYFGTSNMHELSPAIAVNPSPVTYDSSECSNFRESDD
jgi:hypothetical protein